MTADHRLKYVYEWHFAHPSAEHEHDGTQHGDGCGDPVSELFDLAQQWRVECTYRGHHLIDAAHFRVAPGCNDRAGPPPRRNQGS
jgi:hypothetical protein